MAQSTSSLSNHVLEGANSRNGSRYGNTKVQIMACTVWGCFTFIGFCMVVHYGSITVRCQSQNTVAPKVEKAHTQSKYVF